MEDTESDAAPVDSRCKDASTQGHQGFVNRISNRELYERHPSYPKTSYEEPVEPHDLIHIVFVYAKDDYKAFKEFFSWFKEILRTVENGHAVKIADHESEHFPCPYDDNVYDISERAIFILPFLSKSFCTSKVLRFFTSEAIGMTRLDPTCHTGAMEQTIKKQKKYAVRPIHTANPRSGTYRTPTGLNMIRGIDFYSKNDSLEYVEKQVTGIIKEAIRRFDERKRVMVSALTGADQIMENFEESFEKQFGPPPTEPSFGSNSYEDPNALDLIRNGYGVQEQLRNVGMGEDLSLTTDAVATAEADRNTSLTDNTLSDTEGNKNLKDVSALTNGERISPHAIAEDETVNILAEGKSISIDDSTDVGPATSQNDTSLEIDNGSLCKNAVLSVQNGTQKATKGQDQNSTDRALGVGRGVKMREDSGEAVKTNYMSYTGPAVPNVAKAAGSNTAQQKLNGKQAEESPRKKGESIIVIQNCRTVQIGEGSVLLARKMRKPSQKNTAKSETSWNDSSTTQNSDSEISWNNLNSTESYGETRTKMMSNEDTVSKELNTSEDDNDAALFADNIPSDFSRTSTAKSSQGVKMAEEHEEEFEESGSDTDSFLDEKLNDPSLESLEPYEEVPLECTTTIWHGPIIRLCKNTMKRYGLLDSGYHTHFSHIYKTSPTPRPLVDQYGEEVD